MLCQALGYNDKEAIVPDLKEFIEGEALSFGPQPYHKTKQTYGQISQCPSSLWIMFPWKGRQQTGYTE